MAKMILEVHVRGLNQYHRLENFPVTIGRALDNDIILSDDSVSPHHLRLEQDNDGQLLVHNLSNENGSLLNRQNLGQQPVPVLVPGELLLGNRKLRLLSSEMPVEVTNVSRCRGWFAILCHPLSAGLLFLLTVAFLLADNYLSTSIKQGPLFYLSGLLPSLLLMMLWVVILIAVARLVTHRWSFIPAVSIVSLFTLLPLLLSAAGHFLDYWFTSETSSYWLATGGGDFLLLPVLLFVYLHWVINQRTWNTVGIALLLSALPLGWRAMNVLEQITVDSKFSSDPYYHNGLSFLNLHSGAALSIDDFLRKSAEALPSQIEKKAD
jgi:hypothetical protein